MACKSWYTSRYTFVTYKQRPILPENPMLLFVLYIVHVHNFRAEREQNGPLPASMEPHDVIGLFLNAHIILLTIESRVFMERACYLRDSNIVPFAYEMYSSSGYFNYSTTKDTAETAFAKYTALSKVCIIVPAIHRSDAVVTLTTSRTMLFQSDRR